MSNEIQKDEKAAALWREARAAWSEVRTEPTDSTNSTERRRGEVGADALLLAAYLDGGLSEAESAGLEARLARDPGLLEELLALKALEPVAPPTSLVLRAQGLVREPPRAATPAKARGWFGGALLQPLGWAGAMAALLVVCGLSFELGREGWAAASELEDATASLGSPFDASSEFPL